MPTLDILAALEDHLPTKRRVDVEGWPVPVWVWRLDYKAILEVSKLPRETEVERAEFGHRLVAMAIGDEDAPGTFDNERGQDWLRRHPIATLHLYEVAQDFNELTGPSQARAKKSMGSAGSSTSVENSESNIPDDCL
ncbi:MAG TPA: hypothetical protein DDW52_15005 [Planctomycetaceae bacterium]|nr:hypothetical protein [Planctomycetaceae bacterium]